jgi:hypothetical protein
MMSGNVVADAGCEAPTGTGTEGVVLADEPGMN